MLKYHFIEAQHEKHFRLNVANVTFIFGTSPNTKSEEKKWGGHGILYPPI